MTVLPGSLDYLYYNGILDYIPYEAYSLPAFANYEPINPTSPYPYDTLEPVNPYRPLIEESKKEAASKPDKSVIIKGLISAGLIIGTGAALIHGIKKGGFLKKLNPLNWFRKNK